MKHTIVIETAENDLVPSTNPTTGDLVNYLLDAIAVRQGDAPTRAAHTWWMRGATIEWLPGLAAVDGRDAG